MQVSKEFREFISLYKMYRQDMARYIEELALGGVVEKPEFPNIPSDIVSSNILDIDGMETMEFSSHIQEAHVERSFERLLDKMNVIIREQDPSKKQKKIDITLKGIDITLKNDERGFNTVTMTLSNEFRPRIPTKKDIQERLGYLIEDQVECAREWITFLLGNISDAKFTDSQRQILDKTLDISNPKTIERDLEEYPTWLRAFMYIGFKSLQEKFTTKNLGYRNADTLALFPELHEDAVRSLLNDYKDKFSIYTGNDLLREILELDFATDYNKHLEKYYHKNLLTVESENGKKGSWKTYTNNKDSIMALAMDLKGHYVKWCMKARSIAKYHLSNMESFHIFNSKNEKGEDVIPRLSFSLIKNEQGEKLISDIRGIGASQNLDPFIWERTKGLMKGETCAEGYESGMQYELTPEMRRKWEIAKKVEGIWQTFLGDQGFNEEQLGMLQNKKDDVPTGFYYRDVDAIGDRRDKRMDAIADAIKTGRFLRVIVDKPSKDLKITDITKISNLYTLIADKGDSPGNNVLLWKDKEFLDKINRDYPKSFPGISRVE